MWPESNYRQKRLLGETNYNTYLNNERFGYSYQYVRNTVQLNNGISNDHTPPYSEVSMISGISATDWSWAPLVADFDLDGYRDIIITNGFPKDVTDHDFIDYKMDTYRYASKELILSRIPSIYEHNYAYKGKGIKFNDVTKDWGFDFPSYSNGAAYGDLDNDGDLDVVINNINDSLFLMENTLDQTETIKYLQITLKGKDNNPDAIGAQITVTQGSEKFYYEHSVFRGYLSSMSKKIHFGLMSNDQPLNVEIVWPDGLVSKLTDVGTNRILEIEYAVNDDLVENVKETNSQTLMVVDSSFDHKHLEDDFIDYNIQPLLPHKLSQYGPALTVGDINNDGLDDIYVSGSTFQYGYFLLQNDNGTFQKDTLKAGDKNSEENGALIFDINGDGLNDLFVTSGSYEHAENSKQQKDKVYINRNGTLKYDSLALPEYFTNSQTLRGADFDRDGDIDLFVGSRSIQGEYPESPKSFLLENISTQDKAKSEISNALPMSELGMVTDASWTDIDDDGDSDLIITRELNEVLVLQNIENKFQTLEIDALIGKFGFWNSVTSADIDKDGDIDHILGNIGVNTYFPISKEYPYRIYVNDFDKNGSSDALPFVWATNEDGSRSEYPFCSRMDFAKEINAIKKKLPSYKLYAEADLNTLITKETLKETEVFEANYPYSAILWNEGNNEFNLEPLPDPVQVAPIYGSIVTDLDGDDQSEIILIGNDYGTELIFGRMDALNGIVLKQDENRTFQTIKSANSGFLVPDDGKALVQAVVNGQRSIFSSSNKGPIRKFDLKRESSFISIPQDIIKVEIETETNKWVRETPLGNGFLSQQSRQMLTPKGSKNVTGYTSQGEQVDLLRR